MSQSPSRRAYTGSCHCKTIRFIVYLHLPAAPWDPSSSGPGHQRIYRCNCTLCHKTGMMHIRPIDPTEDFNLLAPLDPFTELGNYTGTRDWIRFMFCKTCGVRCFSFGGEGEVTEVIGEDGGKKKVWRPKKGLKEGYGQGNVYLSVNAHAIDAGQEGFDMKGWVDKKCVRYLDFLDLMRPSVEHDPPPGGCY